MSTLFRLNFNTFLTERRQCENRRRQMVADRLGQIGDISEQINSLRRRIRDHGEAAGVDRREGIIDIRQAGRRKNWLGYLHKGVLECLACLQYHRTRLAQERARLDRNADRKCVVKIVKARQWTGHNRYQPTRRTNTTDETAVVRYVFERTSACAGVNEAVKGHRTDRK